MTVLASRTVFLPEVDASSLRLTCREVWPVETTLRRTLVPETMLNGLIVQRPSGDPGRSGDDGYSLKKTLGWN
jgi:hypothetical protein